jgi:hypothetical protein
MRPEGGGHRLLLPETQWVQDEQALWQAVDAQWAEQFGYEVAEDNA